MCVYVCVYLSIYLHIYIYISIYLSTYIYIYICIYIYIYVCVFVCVCLCVCSCVCFCECEQRVCVFLLACAQLVADLPAWGGRLYLHAAIRIDPLHRSASGSSSSAQTLLGDLVMCAASTACACCIFSTSNLPCSSWTLRQPHPTRLVPAAHAIGTSGKAISCCDEVEQSCALFSVLKQLDL